VAFFAGMPGYLELFILLFVVFILALWIWALVDCLTKEPSEGNDKIAWLLVILLLSWVGGLLYLLVRRPRRIREYGR